MLKFCKTLRIPSDATVVGSGFWLIEYLRGCQSSVGFTSHDEESMDFRPSLSSFHALDTVLCCFRSMPVDPIVVHVGLLEQFAHSLNGK